MARGITLYCLSEAAAYGKALFFHKNVLGRLNILQPTVDHGRSPPTADAQGNT